MAVGEAHVFTGFLTPALTRIFFPKPPTTFLSCFCRGQRRKYAGRKFASTGDRTHNHQVMSPTRSPLSHLGGKLWFIVKSINKDIFSPLEKKISWVLHYMCLNLSQRFVHSGPPPSNVMWEISQWLGKNGVWTTGQNNCRKVWIGALTAAIQLK